MSFNNIFEAIEHAQRLNNPEMLNAYIADRFHVAENTIMPAIFAERVVRSDDIYFLLAFGSCLVDLHIASLSKQEQELIQGLKSRLSMMVVKANIPFKKDP